MTIKQTMCVGGISLIFCAITVYASHLENDVITNVAGMLTIITGVPALLLLHKLEAK